MSKPEEAAPTVPYWREIGLDYDPRTKLFHRYGWRPDGSSSHEIMLAAEDLHRLRKENLARLEAFSKQKRRAA